VVDEGRMKEGRMKEGRMKEGRMKEGRWNASPLHENSMVEQNRKATKA
jgi:hypothetical protein